MGDYAICSFAALLNHSLSLRCSLRSRLAFDDRVIGSAREGGRSASDVTLTKFLMVVHINKSNRVRTIDAFSSVHVQVFVLVFVLILVPVLLTVA